MNSKEINKTGEDLAAYINASPTAFHAAAETVRRLGMAGGVELSEREKWNIRPGKLYYVVRDAAAVIAFYSGSVKPQMHGMRICGAHLDSPLLKVKSTILGRSVNIITAGIEVYGSPVYSTWLDRDLLLCGRFVTGGSQGLKERLFTLENLGAIIPNAAIHMNRKVNEEHKYNPQIQLRALLFPRENGDYPDIRDFIAAQYAIPRSGILDAETFLVPGEGASCIFSKDGASIIRAGRIDNLAGCHAALNALINAADSQSDALSMICLYNSEEIGSRTRSGAASVFFDRLLQRIHYCLGLDNEEQSMCRQLSYQVSIDGAHAVHPNYSDKHDPDFSPELNKGVVLKRSAGYKYGTDVRVAAPLFKLAGDCGVDIQEMVNRADLPSGTTIGTISMSMSDIPTVDVGIAMLAMHSARETAGIADQHKMIELVSAFLTKGVSQV